MYIVQKIKDFDRENIFFGKNILNNVIPNGRFIRILYSTPLCTINTILLSLNLTGVSFDKNYIKYKCCFNSNENNVTIQKITIIEKKILSKLNINKKQVFNISDQLCSGNIKVFSDDYNTCNKDIALKISGIWETEKEYGITYKFMFLKKVF